MASELRVWLSEDGAGPERLDALTGLLREELLQLPIEDVRRVPSGQPPPPGTRVFDAAAVGELLVILGGAAYSVRETVAAIMAWCRRGSAAGRTVRLEMDGDVLELSEATTTDQQRLVELFVGRHAGGTGEWTADETH